MIRGSEGKIGLGLTLVAAALWTATSLTAVEAEVDLLDQCEVAVTVEQVPIQAEPVTVALRHSLPLGDTITATVPEESQAAVVSVGREEDDAPNTLRLVLNTEKAVAGEWALTLKSGETECRGVVKIGADTK